MGALEMGLTEDELKPLVTAWRSSNPNITKLWWDVDRAAMKAVRDKTTTQTHGIRFTYKSGMLFITLPSGRNGILLLFTSHSTFSLLMMCILTFCIKPKSRKAHQSFRQNITSSGLYNVFHKFGAVTFYAFPFLCGANTLVGYTVRTELVNSDSRLNIYKV
jgi:hypothetical protein